MGTVGKSDGFIVEKVKKVWYNQKDVKFTKWKTNMKNLKKIIVILSIILAASVLLNIVQLLYIKQIETDVMFLEQKYEKLLEDFK